MSHATAHEGIQPESQEEGAQQQRVVRYVPIPRRQERVGRDPHQGPLVPNGRAGLEREE